MAVRPQCTKLAFSFYKESAYGTQVLDANITKLYQPKEPILLDMTQDRVDDTDTIKGYEFPLDTSLDMVTAQNISIPFTFPSTLGLLGLLHALVFGVDAASGTTPDYTHTFKVADLCANDQLPSTSWVMGFGSDTASYKLAKGLILNELNIETAGKGSLNLSGTAFTDGTLTTKASFSFPTSPTETVGTAGIRGDQSDFLTANAGDALVSKKAKLRGFKVGITNNLDTADGHSLIAATAAKTLSSLRCGNRAITITVNVEGHQGDEFWTDFEAETVKDVQLKVTKSATRSWEIRAKNTKIISCKQSFDGIRDVLELTYKLFWTTADVSPCIAVVKNTDAAYLL